jgi:hypothetical protein
MCSEEIEMPLFEVVTHVTVELAGSTPEEAAALFKRECLSSASAPTVLRDLAVWPSSVSSAPEAISNSIQHQLADFFAAVGRQAANEEEAFRTRVEEIFTQPGAQAALANSRLAREVPNNLLESEDGEGESGGLGQRRLRPWQS